MPVERQTARKVRLKDLTTGKWVSNEGMNPNYVETEALGRVSRARILATVVNVFQAEDGNFASATLDDSTDTIRAKTFKTTKPINKLKEGDLVEAIGKVREYNEEIYIIPEVLRKVEDPNLELLRKLEILKQLKQTGKKPEPSTKKAKPGKGKGKQKKLTEEEKSERGKPEESEEKEGLRETVLDFIGSNKEGVTFDQLLEGVEAEEDEIESVVNDLLSEGICYEPSPGKIRKI